MLFKTTGALERMHIFGPWRQVFIVNDSRRMNTVWGTETSFLLPHAESDAVFMGVYFSGDCSDTGLGSLRRKEIYEKQLRMSGSSQELNRAIVLAGRQLISHSDFKCLDFHTVDFTGRRAAVLEQEWLSTQQMSYQIFVDALSDGRIIYNLMFVAPKHLYVKYLEQAKASFETSLWRAQFDPSEPLRLIQDPSESE